MGKALKFLLVNKIDEEGDLQLFSNIKELYTEIRWAIRTTTTSNRTKNIDKNTVAAATINTFIDKLSDREVMRLIFTNDRMLNKICSMSLVKFVEHVKHLARDSNITLYDSFRYFLKTEIAQMYFNKGF